MDKYAIFHIDGGIGKHIAATAVARCIKNNFPDHKLVIVCAWPTIFINLDFVYRVYKTGITPYFYQDYILNQDSLLFKHEPYFTTNHVYGKKSLIENWCELYGLTYNNEQPQLVFNLREKQIGDKLWNSGEPTMVLQSCGGPLIQENGYLYKWTRDMPIGLIHKIVEEFRPQYRILQVTKPNAPVANGVIPVDKEYSNMEFLTILLHSKKRVLIDSVLQHAAAALNLPSNVLWIGTDPNVFGYDLHNNILANQLPEFKLPDSYIFNYNFEGITHECPYKNEDEIFDADAVINSIKKQGI